MLDYKFYESNVITNDTIVLLHGLGGNYGIFSKQIAAYKKQFHVLAVNLPGHGKSPATDSYDKPFTKDLVANELLSLFDELKIKKVHLVGISLGSVAVHHMLQRAPERVRSAVLGGAITRFTPFASFLLTAGSAVKSFVPYMWLYKSFAYIMMPKSNHASSRKIFIREAVKMRRKDFLAWYAMAHDVKSTYVNVQKKSDAIPKLYISGEEDHLFVEPLLEDTKSDKKARHVLLKQCGHVCNVDKPREFNAESLDFFNENRLPKAEISSAL
ncbi:alpha/beta fold hydrolase [Halobacillus yeomjeoni]|uniref:Alpha/beta hydrolase n=1 Tax=Halobacillus yeomjeoni TaxID=311194 RepID=A0A931HTK1_9BACI|nr:alpha/beta hydrolase [Halobacillus yeomjeoni]MBH0229148.1 alpha/beta hydrolase [Halobacillus yeomjeoni]